MPEPASNPPSEPKPRGWGLVAAGLLLLALALVVIYTSRAAFSSPLALVVVAAIGLAALLFELRLRKGGSTSIRAPLWLNIVGLIAAIVAIFADRIHLSGSVMLVAALAAVVCFGISGSVVLHSLRKRKD